MVCTLQLVFFFQAEDGIRDLVRSRGLGDVYKRQLVHQVNGAAYPERVRIHEMLACKGPFVEMEGAEWERMFAGIR